MNLIFTPRMIVALAALLASTLVAACGLRSTNPSTSYYLSRRTEDEAP